MTIHRRADAATWSDAQTCIGHASFTLPSLNAPIRVDEVYDSILDAEGHSLLR